MKTARAAARQAQAAEATANQVSLAMARLDTIEAMLAEVLARLPEPEKPKAAPKK